MENMTSRRGNIGLFSGVNTLKSGKKQKKGQKVGSQKYALRIKR